MSATTNDGLRMKLQAWLQRETELDGMLSTMLDSGDISAEQYFDLRGGTRFMIDVLTCSLELSPERGAGDWSARSL